MRTTGAITHQSADAQVRIGHFTPRSPERPYQCEWGWQPQQTCFGPFFSNYDPNEGPVGSGEALAEALVEEKRRLCPNGPVQGGPGS